MDKNKEVLHQFIQGMKYDLKENAESNKSFQNGVNGRLFSTNGVLSYSSIKGTIEVYNNPKIIKYLGYYPFKDQLVFIVKYDDDLSIIDLESEDINNKFSCSNLSDETIDYDEYYNTVDIFQTNSCSLDSTSNFPNNEKYIDAIISIEYDSNNNLIENIHWKGNLNLSIDSKLNTLGIDENPFYRRIYFTDYINDFRSFNLKDSKLFSRTSKEFNLFQSTLLLAPIVDKIEENGQLKASTVFYSYRLITENGQVTEFSSFSKELKITLGSGNDWKGGDISENTTKSVIIKCNIPNFSQFFQIELIALEYEAKGAPTKIVSLGIKEVSEVNYFNHFGNESEFDSLISLTDILKRKNTWRYASDLTSIDNKLIVSGLRNNPLPSSLKRLQNDFALKSWDENGDTFDCLMNPKASKYRYIQPSINTNLYIISKRVYDSISVFGSFTIKLINKNTSYEESFTINAENISYENYINEIYNWLDDLQQSTFFLNQFPNLLITKVGVQLVFKRKNETILTDISSYIFSYNTNEVVEDFEEELEKENFQIPSASNSTQVVYGGVSLGFNSGNGIRVSFVRDNELAMTKSTSSNDQLFNIEEPTLKKDFFKGEIYRLGLNLFDKDGYQLFTIPLGDIKVPEIGDLERFIDNGGIARVVLDDGIDYRNFRVIGNQMFLEKIYLKVEVRLSCEYQNLISSYQISYVERTESNRTILCQGLVSPMEKYAPILRSSRVNMDDDISDKWVLPFYGGPTYDVIGLERYDVDPEGEDNPTYEGESTALRRVITSRSLINFDSPDLVYSIISDDKLNNSKLETLYTIETDQKPKNIRIDDLDEVLPAFSRKLKRNDISGEENYSPNSVNISVFSLVRNKYNSSNRNSKSINKGIILERGEVISGQALDIPKDISNNAMTLPYQSFFYHYLSRADDDTTNGSTNTGELWGAHNVSKGYRTAVLKLTEDLFTNDFIDNPFIKTDPRIDDSDESDVTTIRKTQSIYALTNIKVNSEESIYGGKSEQAFSKNTYIPLSDTIPVKGNNDTVQFFTVEGDSYTSLFSRVKNDYGDIVPTLKRDLNFEYSNDDGDWWARYGAYVQSFVVQSSIEPRLISGTRIYNQEKPYKFSNNLSELINSAYLQKSDLRTFIPTPFNFRDNPDLSNIVASSKTKLSGDYIDNWSEFLANDFYELEKNMGASLNLAKFREKIYAIQERQSSMLYINQQNFIPTENGKSIAISQGSGNFISDHQIISDYGTSIRRAIVENEFGFSFIDELRKEFLRMDKPLLIANSLFLKFKELFDNNPIIDSEGYFDDKYKETNFRLRTKSGLTYCISYNEVFKVFNGWIDYNNDIYMEWNSRVFAPITNINENNISSNSLHELNKGVYLNFFNEEKTIKLGVICNINPVNVKIFKHWGGIINVNYNAVKLEINTNLGQQRTILGNHHRYKIREGRHSVPLKNRTDWEDLRGEWMYIEIEFSSLNNEKVDIFSFINFVRHSYQ